LSLLELVCMDGPYVGQLDPRARCAEIMHVSHNNLTAFWLPKLGGEVKGGRMGPGGLQIAP